MAIAQDSDTRAERARRSLREPVQQIRCDAGDLPHVGQGHTQVALRYHDVGFEHLFDHASLSGFIGRSVVPPIHSKDEMAR